MPRDRTIFTTLAAIIIASIALFVLTTTDLQKNQNLSEPLRWAVLHAKSFQSDVIGAMHGQFPIRMAGAIGVLLSLTLAYFTIRTRRSS